MWCLMDKLEAMRVFIEVAECKSFIAASRRLDFSAPAVTRHVRLTDSGARFYEDARRVVEEVDQAMAAASGSYAEPRGVLSVTAPVLFGQIHIAPILTEYLQQNPEVTVRAVFYDRVSNLLDEGLDVAIRIGHLKDSSIYATPVGSVQRLVCASPDYLKKYGMPRQPSDLTKHEIIQASTVESSTTWQFESTAGKESVKVTPRLHCSQNGAAITAARQGFGITRVMSYQVGEELKNGYLTRILRDYETKPLPVSIIHLEGRQANAKIRSFIDLATARLRANPHIDHF